VAMLTPYSSDSSLSGHEIFHLCNIQCLLWPDYIKRTLHNIILNLSEFANTATVQNLITKLK
jgi:hypothetical protein